MFNHLFRAAPVPKEHPEESAQHEEDLHPKTMDEMEYLVIQAWHRGIDVLFRPIAREHQDGGMQNDAKKHRKGTQRIKFMKSIHLVSR